MHVCSFWSGVNNCTEGDVELIQDPADTKIVGYVQYCLEGEWERVCRWDGRPLLWDVCEAVVACRQLGYKSTGKIYNYYLTMVVNYLQDMHMWINVIIPGLEGLSAWIVWMVWRAPSKTAHQWKRVGVAVNAIMQGYSVSQVWISRSEWNG